jgi:hypothetical protein
MRLAIIAALLCPALSWADAPPVLRPLRDVDVTYRVPVPNGGGDALLQRLRWSAATQRQRVDLPTAGNWMVLDFKTHRMSLVRDPSHEVIDLPAPPGAEQPGGSAGFTRIGSATVDGLACTIWRTTDTRGEETQACYTDDGVLLRASAGPHVLMEAVSVKYAPQDNTVFQPPANYTHQQPNR